jgi:hypothetical protein
MPLVPVSNTQPTACLLARTREIIAKVKPSSCQPAFNTLARERQRTYPNAFPVGGSRGRINLSEKARWNPLDIVFVPRESTSPTCAGRGMLASPAAKRHTSATGGPSPGAAGGVGSLAARSGPFQRGKRPRNVCKAAPLPPRWP